MLNLWPLPEAVCPLQITADLPPSLPCVAAVVAVRRDRSSKGCCSAEGQGSTIARLAAGTKAAAVGTGSSSKAAGSKGTSAPAEGTREGQRWPRRTTAAPRKRPATAANELS